MAAERVEPLLLADCHLANNSAGLLADCHLANNSAGLAGGAVGALDSAVLRMESGRVVGNSAPQFGGAGALGDAVVNISGSLFAMNSAGIGGAVGQGGNAQMSISDSTFVANHAVMCGGAVGVAGSIPFLMAGRVSIEANSAEGNGGALCVRLNEKICSSRQDFLMFSLEPGATATLVNNSAGGGGGALFDGCQQVSGEIPISWTADSVFRGLLLGDSVTEKGLPPSLQGWGFGSNEAAYGALAATALRTALVQANASFSYYPGEGLGVVIALADE